MAAGLISSIIIAIPSEGLHAFSVILRLMIIGIMPVIYGRINEIIVEKDFQSWGYLLNKYLLKYLGFLFTVFLAMSVPIILSSLLIAFQIIDIKIYLIMSAFSLFYHLATLYIVPLLFFENSIKESIVLGLKCLIGNFQFNLPIILAAIVLSLLSRSFATGEAGILSVSINYLKWCVWFILHLITFISISMVLSDKIYDTHETEHPSHRLMD